MVQGAISNFSGLIPHPAGLGISLLITGRGGGGYKTGEGAHEVLLLRKGGGGEKVLAVLKEGGTTSFRVA